MPTLISEGFSMTKTASSFLLTLFCVSTSFAWHDETHLAIAKAAGYEKYYNAAGPDMIKVKAGGIEIGNHYFNNNAARDVTPDMVMQQVPGYNLPVESEGHLYGAVIAALIGYSEAVSENRYAEYHLAFAAHYLGDLSNPLHNTPYDEFNKKRHPANDAVIEAEALKNLAAIESKMYGITLSPDSCSCDLAKEIARVANISRELGYLLRQEDRDLTKEEAYVQAGHSASLIRAVLECYRSKGGGR